MARIRLGFDAFGWGAVETTAARYNLGIGELVGAACRRCIAAPYGQLAPPPLIARMRSRPTRRQVTIDLEATELAALERWAKRDHLELEALLRHAVIALVADLDSGRVSRELLADAAPHAGAAGA